MGRLFSYSKKRRISQNGYSLSLVVMRCRLLYHSLSFVLTRCHSFSPVVPLVGTRCHSLSLIVPLVVTRWHSLSFVVSLLFQILFLYAKYILYLKMISKNIFSWDAFKSYTEQIFNKYCSSFTIRVGLLSKLVIGLLYNPVIRWHHNYFWMVVFKVSTLWQSHCFLNIL